MQETLIILFGILIVAGLAVVIFRLRSPGTGVNREGDGRAEDSAQGNG